MSAPSSTEISRPRGWKWTPERKQAALLRAQGFSWDVIAADIKRAVGTVWEWNEWPDFVARIDQLSNAPIEEALLILKANAREAAETVVKIMRTGKAKRDEPRLAAAQDILDRLGVAVGADADAPPPTVNITFDFRAIDIAERAFIAALEGQSVAVGDILYEGQPSGEGADGVPALLLPGQISGGPQSSADDSQSETGRHESDRGA